MTTVIFHDFPGLENSFLKFQDFPYQEAWTSVNNNNNNSRISIPPSVVTSEAVTSEAVLIKADKMHFVQYIKHVNHQYLWYLALKTMLLIMMRVQYGG